jgi:phosphoribosylglycinamide formyltransferase-1
MKRLVLFASGEGSNALNIIKYFQHNKQIEIAMVLSDRKAAPVIEKAKHLGIPALSFNKNEFYNTNFVSDLLKEKKTDLIVLAGFLKLIPEKILLQYQKKIINIHPALLPKYGGKGMWGMHVHAAICASHETETGITIHYVNENFDEGEIIFQKKISLDPDDTPEMISAKVRKLEIEWYPKVIEKVLEQPDKL